MWKASHKANLQRCRCSASVMIASTGDHDLTSTNRHRTGLRLALAACWAGDTSVVTKLYRLARSLPGARDILDGLPKRNVKLTSSAAQSMDRTDRVGRCCSSCWRWWLSSNPT